MTYQIQIFNKHVCNVWGQSNENPSSEMSGTLIFDNFLSEPKAEYLASGKKNHF